jgi:L-ascorbate metabolism protein UlaG (beta-lactamase superfamily)
LKITWHGTATIAYTQQDRTILFDPFFGWNRKIEASAPDRPVSCDHIFITHGHFDHVMAVPEIMAKGEACVSCSRMAAERFIRLGVKEDRVNIIAPGQTVAEGPFLVRVLAGEHIVFDGRLILMTVFNVRMIRHFVSLLRILRASAIFKKGQVLIFDIECDGKRLLHMGSLNFAEKEQYSKGVDILVMPFQGRSDMANYALAATAKINPRVIYLHHIDDAFPPISRTMETGLFTRMVQKKFPAIKIISPARGEGQSL